jgi:hypothetical protein
MKRKRRAERLWLRLVRDKYFKPDKVWKNKIGPFIKSKIGGILIIEEVVEKKEEKKNNL